MLAERLKDETGRSIEATAADLNAMTELARTERMLRKNASITLLVNNAGIGAAAPLLESDVERMDKMICLNVRALTQGDLCRGARICRTRLWHHHQHLLDRCDIARNTQRRLWRQQSVRAGLQPIALA